MVRSHALLTLAATAFVALSGTARADETSAQAFVDRLSTSAALPTSATLPTVTVSAAVSQNPSQAFIDRFSAPSHPVVTEVADSVTSSPAVAFIARLSSSSESNEASSVELATR